MSLVLCRRCVAFVLMSTLMVGCGGTSSPTSPTATVSQPSAPVAVAATPKSASISGQNVWTDRTATFVLNVTYSDGSTKVERADKWSSSAPPFAQVDDNGLVKGVKAVDQVAINAEFGALKAQLWISVEQLKSLGYSVKTFDPELATGPSGQFLLPAGVWSHLRLLQSWSDGSTVDVTGNTLGFVSSNINLVAATRVGMIYAYQAGGVSTITTGFADSPAIIPIATVETVPR